MKRANRTAPPPAWRRGTCPVCRRPGLVLRQLDGKVGPHGKNAANPAGCAGQGEPPYREVKQPAAGTLPVSPIREQVPHDQAPMPGLVVTVERRDEPVTLRGPSDDAA